MPYQPRTEAVRGGRRAVDLAVLDRCLGGDTTARERLLGVFVDSLRELVPAFERALLERDGAALARLGHTLKSSARTVGAHRLGDACEALERAARSGCWTRIGTLVPVLREQAGAVLGQLGSHLQ